MTKTVAIFNANSAQAAPFVDEAIAQGLNVRAITRSSSSKSDTENVVHYTADLLNKDQVVAALTGIDAAFLHLPVPSDFSHPEIWLGNFIAAAHEISLPLLVFSTSGPAGDDFPKTPMIDGTTAAMNAIQSSGLNVITLQPTVYLENLFVPPFVPDLHSEGRLTYPPVPATQKIAFVSHKDQATIGVAALQRPDLAGQTFKIASPNAITGPDLAKALEEWTSKPVIFAPQSPDEFGAHIGKLFGNDAVGHGLAGLYKSIIGAGNSVAEIDVPALEKTFDVKLTSIENHISQWPKQ